MPNKFPFQTNKFVEEEVEIPVMTPVVNEKMKRVEFTQTKQKATRKTYYADSPSKRIICAGGKHVFRCLDKGKYIFKCKNCDFYKIAYPVTYKFNEKIGQLTHRITGVRV